MEYKLGELLEQVYENNIDLKYGLNDIVGVTIEKGIIPTIANLSTTDLSKFIIVKPNYFIYNPRTHGKKIGLGYNNTKKEYIATWNNNVFRVKDKMKNLINTDYLYLCFNRDIWDKEACFNAWGSSTVVLLWENFCNIKINLPPIEEQENIVKKFKEINNFIDIKNNIIIGLERIADLQYLKLVENNMETNKVKLKNIAKISAGGDNPGDVVEKKDEHHKIPVYSNGTRKDGLFGYTKKEKISENSITISARGAIGYTVYHNEPYCPIVRLISVTPYDDLYTEFLYFVLKNNVYAENGTSQQQVTIPYFEEMEIEVPKEENLMIFHENIKSILNNIATNKKIINSLEELKINIISSIEN
ncbi:MAG: hypothetical protein HFJ48_07175 [Clostridia bacterium]|nr:hypothetical protein [Clostridia bacterium]